MQGPTITMHPVSMLLRDSNNTLPKVPKYTQGIYYDGTFIPNEINDHTTGHNVSRI